MTPYQIAETVERMTDQYWILRTYAPDTDKLFRVFYAAIQEIAQWL